MANRLTVAKAVRLCLTKKLDFEEFKAIYELYKETKDDMLGEVLIDPFVRYTTNEELAEIEEIKNAIKSELEETKSNKR